MFLRRTVGKRLVEMLGGELSVLCLVLVTAGIISNDTIGSVGGGLWEASHKVHYKTLAG